MENITVTTTEVQAEASALLRILPDKNAENLEKSLRQAIEKYMDAKMKALENTYPQAYEQYVNGFLLGINRAFWLLDNDGDLPEQVRYTNVEEPVNQVFKSGYGDFVSFYFALNRRFPELFDSEKTAHNLVVLKEIVLGERSAL